MLASAAPGIAQPDDLLVIVADSVAARRDATPEGLDAAIAAAERASARGYESWRGWITELAPIWSEFVGDQPMPRPSPRD